MPELTVTSEIYQEYDYQTSKSPSVGGNVISEFPFILKQPVATRRFDKDNDLDVERPQKQILKIDAWVGTTILPILTAIVAAYMRGCVLDKGNDEPVKLQEQKAIPTFALEHSSKTGIALVGLQVWRGAFLLGDLLIHLGLNGDLQDKTVLELGAGTGLTSFVAAMFAKKVLCTDIDVGEILDLIRLNVRNNATFIKSAFEVMPLDFTVTNWSARLTSAIKNTDIVIAADVIYDDDVTAAFVSTIQKILNTKPPKTLYVVLEKRYVFTIEHLDSVAPCYETFLTLLDKIKTDNIHSTWKIEQLPINFPKYFIYDRVKELVLWKITSEPTE